MTRVGIDYLPATTHFPGVGRYARELVRALVHLDRAAAGDLELRLFEVGGAVRSVPAAALGLEDASLPAARRRLRVPRRIAEPFLRAVGADRWAGGVDLFHRMHAGTPHLARARSILAISDLPKDGDPNFGARAAALQAEDFLLAFSDEARSSLIERFGIPADRIHRVPVGADHWMRDLAARGTAPPVRADPPLVLVLGALRLERHHDDIVDAFDRLVASGQPARLVLAGADGDGGQHVRRRLAFSSARQHVEWKPFASEADVAELVARASVLVHLAETEATAVTPLEALSAGTPVLVSDLPAFREALGDLARYVPTPLSLRHRKALPDDLAASIADSRDVATEARRRALGARYTWAASAAAHAAIYHTLAAR